MYLKLFFIHLLEKTNKYIFNITVTDVTSETNIVKIFVFIKQIKK
jgi:hypothetical protein